MTRVSRQSQTKGAEEARKQLPALVAAAAEGRTTIITRHGRAVAAVVPASQVSPAKKQSPLTSLAGSGKGLKKIEQDLGWQPQETWQSGLAKTIQWYQENTAWVERTRSGAYRDYYMFAIYRDEWFATRAHKTDGAADSSK